MDRTKQKQLNRQRTRRLNRTRRQIRDTSQRPRLSVCRSLRYISAQIIDDGKGHTLAAASTLQKDVADGLKSTCSVEAAKRVGKTIAERAIAAGVTEVKFDRGGLRYHGRIAALAEAAREAGLKF